jgi:glycosyltransferase involved in cell wall biosynthesis
MKDDFSILVPENNPDNLAQAILELIKDNKKRELFAKNGLQYVSNHYNDQLNVEKMERILIDRLHIKD